MSVVTDPDALAKRPGSWLTDQLGELLKTDDALNPHLYWDPRIKARLDALAGAPVTVWELDRSDDPSLNGSLAPTWRWVNRPNVAWLAWADVDETWLARQAVPRADVAVCDLCAGSIPTVARLWWCVLPVKSGQSVWLFTACFPCAFDLRHDVRPMPRIIGS